jgi:hypothetical protein
VASLRAWDKLTKHGLHEWDPVKQIGLPEFDHAAKDLRPKPSAAGLIAGPEAHLERCDPNKPWRHFYRKFVRRTARHAPPRILTASLTNPDHASRLSLARIGAA